MLITIFAAFCRVYHYGKMQSFSFLQKEMGLSLKRRRGWVGERARLERRERKRDKNRMTEEPKPGITR